MAVDNSQLQKSKMKSSNNQATNLNIMSKTKMPPGIPYIISNELAQTASSYGMTAILVVFMTHHLFDNLGNHAFTELQAMVWYHNYCALASFVAVIGAIIADVFWGKYKTIMVFSIIYCFGHLTLAFIDSKTGFACGLILVAIGRGGIMPCVFSHLGDQFNRKNYHLIDRAYGWFYLSINAGSFILILLEPYLLSEYGSKVAFSVPALLMFIATITFYRGKKIFITIPPIGWRKYFKELQNKDNLKAIGNLTIIFSFAIVFYALYGQSGSSWVLQAEKMNCNIDVWFLHFIVYPAQLQALNPIFILVFVPVFSYIIYPFVGKFTKVTHLKKIAAGFFIMAASFAIISYAQTLIENGKEVGIIWQFWAFFLLTASEILVAITSLEICYIYSPRPMKSLALALYVLSDSLGDKLTASVNHYLQDANGNSIISASNYFWYFTGAMAITGIMFVIYIPFYKGRVSLQKMKTSLPLRSIGHYSKIKHINEIIVKIAEKKAAFIFLIGNIASRDQQKNPHINEFTTDESGNNCNFLIVTKRRKYARKEAATELENKIRNKIISNDIHIKTITITIESIDQFNLRSDSTRLFKEGVLLRFNNQTKLSEPKLMTGDRRIENAQKNYKHWYNKGMDFLKSYKILRHKLSDNGLLVLFLHQATESFYNCSLTVLTGNKPHSHELERLNYLLCIESNQFADIFPSSSKEEKECFKILENGYIDSRYNLNYLATNEQLDYLVKKIEDLKDITKEVCEKEIENLELEMHQTLIT